MLRRVLLTTLGAAALATSVFAAPDMDPICPPASSIKAAGFSDAKEIFSNLYIALQEDTYGTDKTWGFILGPVDAYSPAEAMDKSNQFLNTLNGPVSSEEADGIMLCLYDTASPDVTAVAFYADMPLSQQTIRQVLKISKH